MIVENQKRKEIEIGNFKTDLLTAIPNYLLPTRNEKVLILPSFDGSNLTWEKIIKLLANQGYLTYCPSLPGSGQTFYLRGKKVAQKVRDKLYWLENLMKKLRGILPLIIIAHSAGAHLLLLWLRLNYENMFVDSFIKKAILYNPLGLTQEVPAQYLKMRNWFYFQLVRALVWLKKYYSPDAKRFYDNALKNHAYEFRTGLLSATTETGLKDELVMKNYIWQIAQKIKLHFLITDNMFPESYKIIREMTERGVCSLTDKSSFDYHSYHLKNPQDFCQIVLGIIN